MAPSKQIFILFFLVSFAQSECYNILAIFNIPSKSIHLAAVSMVEILAEKGHNVTFVTQFPYSGKSKNIGHVFLKDTAEINKRIFVNFFEFEKSSYSIFYDLEKIGVHNCRLTFQDAAFKNLLKANEKFDLLIVDLYVSMSLLYIAEYYKVPVLVYSSFDSNYAINHLVGNPAPPSYVPNIFLKYSGDMSFFQRLENTMISLTTDIIRNFYTIPNHDKLVKEFFPNAPDISEYLYKGSVLLLNSDVSVMEAMPKTPGMVHIGGYHIKKPKGLPKDLDRIMKNANHGVIFFSLGSNIRSSQMPKETVIAINEVFSRLNQTVIWKWEDEDLPGKPSNVVVRKWLPQNDILAHENVKLFITHGGQHSILETVHHGIPCVSIPVFMDQGANSYRASQLGYAEWIPYKEFTPEKFEKAIIKVLNDPRYRRVVKKRSKIMHDKLLSPQEELAYWVEYVVRHDGAPHFRTAALKLNWYQYLLLDVVLFTVMCSVLFLFLLKQFCKKNLKNKLD